MTDFIGSENQHLSDEELEQVAAGGLPRPNQFPSWGGQAALRREEPKPDFEGRQQQQQPSSPENQMRRPQ